MSKDESEVEGDGNNEATKHDVHDRLMIEATEVVAQKEAGAAALPGDHTPQKKELTGVYHAKAVTTNWCM